MRSWLFALFLTLALAHALAPTHVLLDWPTLVLLGLASLFAIGPSLDRFLPLIKSLKIGNAELELREKTDDLAKAVEQSESTAPKVEPEDEPQPVRISTETRLLDITTESEILRVASTDRIAAILRLGVEVERELTFLSASLGYLGQVKLGSVRELIRILTEKQIITSDVAVALSDFWTIRNNIAHSRSEFSSDDPVLTSFLDSGLRILRLLKAVPRATYVVRYPKVQLYKDAAGTEPAEAYAVIFDAIAPDGMRTEAVYPAGREFEKGEIVAWEWDLKRVYSRLYYRHPRTGEVSANWSSSAAFVGRRIGKVEVP